MVLFMTTSTAKKSGISVPRGVSGKQRQMFLSLTDEQKSVYRWHFDNCGRPATICYRVAIGELKF